VAFHGQRSDAWRFNHAGAALTLPVGNTALTASLLPCKRRFPKAGLQDGAE